MLILRVISQVQSTPDINSHLDSVLHDPLFTKIK